MSELEQLFDLAGRYTAMRESLARDLLQVDERFKKNKTALENKLLKQKDLILKEKDSGIEIERNKAQKTADAYLSMQSGLLEYKGQAERWCPRGLSERYSPQPERVNESELNQLLSKLQAEGFIAWIKRTFRIGGFASRAEMAMDLYEKIEDGCAYCQAKITRAEEDLQAAIQTLTTAARRKTQEADDGFACQMEELLSQSTAEREAAQAAISRFDSSAELAGLHERIQTIIDRAEHACGRWGEYSPPETMPNTVQLCSVELRLPDPCGIEKKYTLPVNLDLFSSNTILVTGSNIISSGVGCPEKQLVRQLLARLIKTVPPENISYTIFDSLLNGASLERLIEITNIGTTDISFDLFTVEEQGGDLPSCSERRQYLRNRPVEVNVYRGGRSDSLFRFNKTLDSFEMPFYWIVDFNYPDDPDERTSTAFREMLINADAAGYSFVLVTGPEGAEKFEAIAGSVGTSVVRLDLDQHTCLVDGRSYPLVEADSPRPDQIYNFMTALKNHFDDSGRIDNRIDSVFLKNGLKMMDAGKKLVVPMALDSRGRLVNLELGGEGSVHGFISGGTNSGKSTLLHTVILSACLHYTPEDLQIWLADYKSTEFALYRDDPPPHIKLIGVSKTEDFTFSLIDKIIKEAEYRTDLLNTFHAQNLEEYRRHSGSPGYVEIPRLLIVIDEFHEMSQFVANEPEYKDKLENILREYRAQGITCLLADQTFSTGLAGLTSAAKNQIGLRIAMRNEASPQEVKDTLEVDRALYSDSIEHTISIMSQGDFIMKTYVRNQAGVLTDIRLEKFKALHTKGSDLRPCGRALQIYYRDKAGSGKLLYVNTNVQAAWDDSEPAALDEAEPLRFPNIRLYLGRTATLSPCFGLDIGRQPNENLSIVGGTAHQRWELISSILHSCRYRGYKILVFTAEYSNLIVDHGPEIYKACASVPGAEILDTTEKWCSRLEELQTMLDEKRREDLICLFIGLEVENEEMQRLPPRPVRGGQGSVPGGTSFLDSVNMGLSGGTAGNPLLRYAMPGSVSGAPQPTEPEVPKEYNALGIIDNLFSQGSKNGIRCIAEVSVYRQFKQLLHIQDMIRHKIAFSMGADDCMMYLGSSSYQKSIGKYAVYCDGGRSIKKLIPYVLA